VGKRRGAESGVERGTSEYARYARCSRSSPDSLDGPYLRSFWCATKVWMSGIGNWEEGWGKGKERGLGTEELVLGIPEGTRSVGEGRGRKESEQ
jgi:hypothetical protein